MDSGTIPAVSIPAADLMTIIKDGFFYVISLWPHAFQAAKSFLSFLVVVSIPISLFFLIGIVYCVEQLKKIKKKYEQKHDVKIEPAFEEVKGQGDRDLAIKWQKITSLMNSTNPSDWKHAILEADTMLLDILTGLGYQGDGVGEKLKRVKSGEFQHIDDAWEAHKVRNDIAHGRGDVLDHHKANQVIQRYRRVFEEFYYI